MGAVPLRSPTALPFIHTFTSWPVLSTSTAKETHCASGARVEEMAVPLVEGPKLMTERAASPSVRNRATPGFVPSRAVKRSAPTGQGEGRYAKKRTNTWAGHDCDARICAVMVDPTVVIGMVES